MKKIILSLLFLTQFTILYGSPTFLTLADIHFDGSTLSTGYGDDTGIHLWENTLLKTKALLKKTHPSFILVMGDLPAHEALNHHRRTNTQNILLDLRTKLENTTIPIFLIPGNNDTLYGNYHSYSDKAGHSILQLDPDWPALHTEESCTTPTQKPCIINNGEHFRFGYYSAYPLGKQYRLRLIVLNSVIFTNEKYIADDGISQKKAAKKELLWFKHELIAAKQQKDAVLIATHIPPGKDIHQKLPLWKKIKIDHDTLLNQFITLLAQYKKNIRLIITAHTHTNERREIFDIHGRWVTVAIAAPSISPNHGNDPSIKVFNYDPKNYVIEDSTTYFTTPSARNWGNQQNGFRKTHSCGQEDMITCIKNLRVLPDKP